ncbi:MAG: hypothetical protein SF187_10480 [Deltaproteobacteria bacterium]|nr:hypothetical protein [Deltaproteobacteria bacterium]
MGIKNLKNNLSRYLDLVREGEVVYVTDRDEIIAEIHRPVSPATVVFSRWEAFLNEQERTGGVLRSTQTGPSQVHSLTARLTDAGGGVNLQDVMDELRSDRFDG